DGPALLFGVAAVHPEQIAREERRLVAARARADLEEQVRVVVRILRHEMQRQLALPLLAPLPQRRGLLLAERAQLAIGTRRELLGGGEILLELPVRRKVARDGLEASVLPGQLAKAILVRD